MDDRIGTRPGGRSARVRCAVLDAADDLVGRGVVPITVKALSDLAEVSEPTIYRRWRSAENVVLEAAVRHLTTTLPIAATGDLRRDLTKWAENLERGLKTPAGLRFLSVVVTARTTLHDGDAVRSLLDRRVDQLRALLEQDHAPPTLTVDHILDGVLAPLYIRQIFGRATSRRLAGEFVASVLRDVDPHR